MAGNWLFPDEPLLDKARAWFTGMGAKDPLGLNIPPQQTMSEPRGDLIPYEKARRDEQLRNAMEIANFAGGIRAFHGSPHRFTRFDSSKIGTGEGAQVYGYGHYLAEQESIGRHYRDKLAKASRLPDDVLVRYFTPGEIVPSYGGRDRIIAYDPKSRVVTAQAVDYNGKPIEPPRQHRTAPSLQDITQVFRARNEPPFQPGYLYEVDINTTPNRLLDWDRPFSGQSSYVQGQLGDFVTSKINSMNAAREKLRGQLNEKIRRGISLSAREQELLQDMTPDKITGKKIYQMKEVSFGAQRPGEAGPQTAEALRLQGIPGIQYLDAGSRAAGEGSRNYVIFDDNLLDILRRYGTLGPVSAGVVNSLLGGQDDPRQ